MIRIIVALYCLININVFLTWINYKWFATFLQLVIFIIILLFSQFLYCCFNAKNVSEFKEQDAYSLEIFDTKDTLTSKLTKTFSNVAYEAPPRETKLIFKTTVGLFYQSRLPNTFNRSFWIKHKTPLATNYDEKAQARSQWDFPLLLLNLISSIYPKQETCLFWCYAFLRFNIFKLMEGTNTTTFHIRKRHN